jgi:rhamnulokinase
MSVAAVAAVDLGATSGRVVLGNVGPDTLHIETITRFPNLPVTAGDGMHWNLLGLHGAALAGLRDAFRAEPAIASIGIDSWAVDYGLLRRGRLLGEPFHYRDDRTTRGVPSVHSRVTREQLYAQNGLQFLPFNTLYQLAAEPRDHLDFADQLLLIPDLIGYWLTGQLRAETTNASTTGLLTHQRWNTDLIDRLGLPQRLFPELIEPGQTLGQLLPDVAASLGGTAPVIAVGSHDTASAVVAIPMKAESAAYISCGTWGLVGVEVDKPILTDAARRANFTNEGGVDGRTRLLHNVMGLWVLSEAVRSWERAGQPIDLPTLLDSAAEVTAPMPVFDVNDPRFLAPGDMPTRIDAWCVEHDVAPPRTRAEYARSIVESLAQAFADAVRDAARIGDVNVSTVHVVGGGALNELLCQRTADRSGLPVLAGPVEATALGNVLVQARAGGFITGSLDALRGLVSRTHAPRLFSPHG